MGEADVTREEFTRLADRVSTVEQEVEGEKLVSRYILSQARQNGDDLAVLKTRFDRVEAELLSLKSDFSSLRNDVSSLRKDLPAIVADAMRDVLRGQQQD